MRFAEGDSREHREVVLDRDREKTAYAIVRRAQVIKRIGLPAVRQHRLEELNREAQALRTSLSRRAHVAPELDSVILLRLESRA